MKIRRFMTCVLFMILFTLKTAVCAQAMDHILLPFSDDTVTIHVETEVPDGFQEDMEIYLNGSPYYMSESSGYEMEIELKPGKYNIRVLSYSDMAGRYGFLAPETIDTETESAIRVTVIDTWEEVSEREGHEPDGDHEEGWEEWNPEQIDLSDGRPFGTLLITSETYGAVKSAVYCLVGAEKVYEIPLKNEYAGCAKVFLPAGDYYESGTIKVELAKNAAEPEGITYLWQHRDNRGVWGNYYHVDEGKTVEIDDLIIMMAVDGDTAELNSNALFSGTLIKNREHLMESHYQRELESAFPERGTENQIESIAVVYEEPVEEIMFGFWGNVLPILAGIAGCIVLFFLALWIKRRKR